MADLSQGKANPQIELEFTGNLLEGGKREKQEKNPRVKGVRTCREDDHFRNIMRTSHEGENSASTMIQGVRGEKFANLLITNILFLLFRF